MSSEISAADVLERAEDMWDSGDEWPTLAKSDPESIGIEVLSQLSMLNVQLICAEDIPEIRLFLEAAPGSELLAWRRWLHYWDSMDHKARASQLASDSLYLTAEYTD